MIGGVIDTGYRGKITVMLHNVGSAHYHVQPGDRIAQLIVTNVHRELEEVSKVSELGLNTLRGSKGLGSTGR